MNSNSTSLIIALGTSLSVATNAFASSPNTLFQAKPLTRGYQNIIKIASSNPKDKDDGEIKTPQGKCGAGKCSSNKNGMGKCGTGKCGATQHNEKQEDDDTNEANPTKSKE